MKLVKMHGIGNDYIFADCMDRSSGSEALIADPSPMAVSISDRHFGVGADGLILLCPSERADCEMKVYNADGSYAYMCGNGVRCAGKYLYDNGYITKDSADIESGGSIKHLKLVIENGICTGARVNMGKPMSMKINDAGADSGERLAAPGAAAAPTAGTAAAPGEDATPTAGTAAPGEDAAPTVGTAAPGEAAPAELGRRVCIKGRDFTLVSMGNPHAVNFTRGIDSMDIEKIGPEIEHDSTFPDRTNVEFIEITGNNELKMRVWERGSGETLACGTGACASAVAAVLGGYCKAGKITVSLKGGTLEIEWDGADGNVYMTGPAAFVCEIQNFNIKMQK